MSALAIGRYSRDDRFKTTIWPIVVNAADPGSPEARDALAELCRAYWYPIYAFVRRRNHTPEQAEDLTQGFFADLLARGSIGEADPAKGRFRSFLLASLSNYLSNQRSWERRVKRGGKVRILSIDFRDAEDRYLQEPMHAVTPERLFERRWALTVLDRSLDRLGGEMAHRKKQRLFEVLKPVLTDGLGEASFVEIGAALGMSEGAVRVAAHRLRRRYRQIIREEIGRTVADPDQLGAEIDDLFLALRV